MVDKQNSSLSISSQCKLLEIHRSGLYYHPVSESEENLRLMRLLDEQYFKTPFYGVRHGSITPLEYPNSSTTEHDIANAETQQSTVGTDFWTGLGFAGLGFTATGGLAEAYGLGKQSLWQSKYGWRSGYTAPISKWTTFGKAAGNTGTMIGAFTLANDGYQVSQGQMSGWRFGYHLAAFGTSAYTGWALGGPYGAAAGVGLGVAELGYDHLVEPYVVEPARQEFNHGFNSWLRGVYGKMGVPGY